jgi:hypothetical protein
MNLREPEVKVERPNRFARLLTVETIRHRLVMLRN